MDVDHADLAGSLHHLPYRTTLRLGAKLTVHRWLGSGGSGSVFFERVMAASLRYNEPAWISPEGFPYFRWADCMGNWHEMGQFTRSSDLCAPMKPVSRMDADDWHQVATFYFWQTDSKEIEQQRYYLLKTVNKAPEIVSFWRVPKDDDPSGQVSEALISQLEVRMTMEQPRR